MNAMTLAAFVVWVPGTGIILDRAWKMWRRWRLGKQTTHWQWQSGDEIIQKWAALSIDDKIACIQLLRRSAGERGDNG